MSQLLTYIYNSSSPYKNIQMKKVFLLASVAFLLTGSSFAENGKKKKKGAKSKTSCSKSTKSCCKHKTDKTAKL